MRITVFTPTFNRGYIIESLYRSLQKQTFTNFEWIIVDDGSTDNTEELINQFISENNIFPIVYCKKTNGGKHRAINDGLRIAKGEMFFIVDSDDYLTNNSLEIIDKVEKTIPLVSKQKFAGVCGLKGYSISDTVGSTFDGEYLDITSLEREKYRICGDKSEVFYTELLKKYRFPEFEGENFITECVVWDKIAYDNYKLRFFNEIVYICDYLPDGLSANSDKLFKKTPKGYGLYLYQSDIFGKNKGLNKWTQYFKYYNLFRNNLSYCEMAKNIRMNPIIFFLRITGMKIFYKLYDR